MNDIGFENDDAVFDRLADGELTADERRALLASLDARPDGWRRCALAFVEAQTWRREMQRMIQEPAAATPALSAAPKVVQKRWPPTSAWLAAAAGIVVAFGLGWELRPPASPGSAVLVAEAPGVESDGPDDGSQPGHLPDEDAITLVVHDQQGQPRRMQVPLVEGRRLGGQFSNLPQWAAPAVRRQLAEQGLDLQARRRYAPLYFEQEDQIVPMIVPVDDAVVSPVSWPIY